MKACPTTMSLATNPQNLLSKLSSDPPPAPVARSVSVPIPNRFCKPVNNYSCKRETRQFAPGQPERTHHGFQAAFPHINRFPLGIPDAIPLFFCSDSRHGGEKHTTCRRRPCLIQTHYARRYDNSMRSVAWEIHSSLTTRPRKLYSAWFSSSRSSSASAAICEYRVIPSSWS